MLVWTKYAKFLSTENQGKTQDPRSIRICTTVNTKHRAKIKKLTKARKINILLRLFIRPYTYYTQLYFIYVASRWLWSLCIYIQSVRIIIKNKSSVSYSISIYLETFMKSNIFNTFLNLKNKVHQ